LLAQFDAAPRRDFRFVEEFRSLMAINDDSQTVSTDAKWLLKRLWRNSCALSAHHCRFERPLPVRSACNQWPYLTAEEVGISGGWRTSYLPTEWTESESSRDNRLCADCRWRSK